ncbi:hypothetical protein N9V16_06995 [SAR116 cluster bacterium]|nr:hypothetical protein [SAR116 cluster bacterium]
MSIIRNTFIIFFIYVYPAISVFISIYVLIKLLMRPEIISTFSDFFGFVFGSLLLSTGFLYFALGIGFAFFFALGLFVYNLNQFYFIFKRIFKTNYYPNILKELISETLYTELNNDKKIKILFPFVISLLFFLSLAIFYLFCSVWYSDFYPLLNGQWYGYK